MRADNLESLFTTAGESPTSFHQGTVLTWNQQTGANTVSVAGSILTNVPVLNTGEAIALKAGHVVGLTKWRTQWFIIGRITVPNTTAFASASVAFATAEQLVDGFTINKAPPFPLIVSTTIAVPQWATQAAVTCHAYLNCRNTSAQDDNLNFEVAIAGGITSGAYPQAVRQNALHILPATRLATLTVTGGGTISLGAYAASSAVNWGFSGDNHCFLQGLAIFRSTV